MIMFLFLAGQTYFSLFQSLQTGFGVHTNSYAAGIVWNLLRGQKEPGREAVHTSLSEV